MANIVESLEEALQKEGISLISLKPSHFATLRVFIAEFLDAVRTRPQKGVRRWGLGFKKHIRESAVEPEAKRREDLASQCGPLHYDDSGAPQLVIDERASRAIASAIVTCELCHQGFAGHDAFEQHCRLKHGNLAEARKRIFYKARTAGLWPLLPWVKRQMVQAFQFFRLLSVPSS